VSVCLYKREKGGDGRKEEEGGRRRHRSLNMVSNKKIPMTYI
jgi:hypothetical protein